MKTKPNSTVREKIPSRSTMYAGIKFIGTPKIFNGNTIKEGIENIIYDKGYLPVTNGKVLLTISRAELRDEVIKLFDSATQATEERLKVTENTSDGYHTFKELYEFRKVYNAVLFNEWYQQDKYQVHKSKKHSDGEKCFGGGWFIVVATLPTGDISNHYEMKDWDLFNCEERKLAKEWDGHTAQDVVERLLKL